MRGRKPKPTHLKVLEGNPGRRPLNPGEVQCYASVFRAQVTRTRKFPEGARVLGLNGAEIVFNPSATVAGLSEYLWELEQPAHAVANGYFVGAINRVGTEKPWNIGEFYGKSYFCNPRGKIVAQASRDMDEVLTRVLGEPEKGTQTEADESKPTLVKTVKRMLGFGEAPLIVKGHDDLRFCIHVYKGNAIGRFNK